MRIFEYLELAKRGEKASAICLHLAALTAEAELHREPVELLSKFTLKLLHLLVLHCRFKPLSTNDELKQSSDVRTVASFMIVSSGAPRLARPISCENCAKSGSANSGTCPSSSWHTSL